MNNGQTPVDDGIGGKPYSAKVHAKAHSSNGCSFCWFVMSLYPSLTGMTEKDSVTFKAHLVKVHGLTDEICT
ncbi:MAG: hypothetical protein JRM86_02570 [Nitrososphaerota archaeon]|nr:hypothetical protein [Nitrososphaerota archaeon]